MREREKSPPRTEPVRPGSSAHGFIAIALLNIVSFVPEAWLLRRVYNSCSDLRHREARNATKSEATGEEGQRGAGGPEQIEASEVVPKESSG